VDTGSREENASNQEAQALTDSDAVDEAEIAWA
jgi:hypothetical protein